jgi:methanogen homoaconitase small subunit
MRPNDDVGDAAFIEARPDFNQGAKPGDVIVAGSNFGCGSSREYAPLALKRRQIGAIIAVDFARIFFRNAINLGIPIFADAEIVAELDDGDVVHLDLERGVIESGEKCLTLPNVPEFTRQITGAGGIVAYVRRHGRFPGEV